MLNVQVKKVEIPTYVPYEADPNPIFFQNRNIQGTCGKIFPMAMQERLGKEFKPVAYEQVQMENEYIDVALMPELGGKIYSALDKSNGYDFIYRNRVIKPAMIGLCGPWTSGGIEFNWPQHHRPTTFSRVAYAIENNPDGSITTWMGEVEPLNRTKGMVGITLYPDRSYIEAKVRLFNRTDYPQTFLWWANLAVAVNDQYRSVFPEDIHWASDHAWALCTEFPVVPGMYKGADFGNGVDIRNFPDVPLPASFFTYNSKYDFLSGYDHGKKGGIVHIADRHVGVGKKEFTWGVSDAGQAWFANLTDEDGPYIELMTGVFSCNQPDFAWLMPHEAKTAVQYWYPIREIGEVKNATLEGAIGAEFVDDHVRISLNTTSKRENAVLTVWHQGRVISKQTVCVAPNKPWHGEAAFCGGEKHEYEICLASADGKKLVSYQPEKPVNVQVPAPLEPAPQPKELDNPEKLYLHALHLWQYRHPCFSPVPYLQRALEIDPEDVRCNTLLGKIRMEQGMLEEARALFEKAISRSTMRNPTPYDVEPYAQLGVCLKLLGEEDAAYEALYRAYWGHAWKSHALYLMAQLALKRGDMETALQHAEECILTNGLDFAAIRLKASILRRICRPQEALEVLQPVLAKDRLDYSAMYEQMLICEALGETEKMQHAEQLFETLTQNNWENQLDTAIEYGDAGLYEEALRLLAKQPDAIVSRYYAAFYTNQLGQKEEAMHILREAAQLSVKGCLHFRLSTLRVFAWAAQQNAQDAKAPYLLGNMFYHKDQFAKAIECFRLSVERGADFPTAYRNLAIGLHDFLGDKEQAGKLMEKAFEMDPTDCRVFFELMQYQRSAGVPVQERIKQMERHMDLVVMREDLYTKYIAACTENGDYEKAIDLLTSRVFRPYEGGEGVVTREHIMAHQLLGMEKLTQGDAASALKLFETAATVPENYHEGRKFAQYEQAHLYYYIGAAREALGDAAGAQEAYERSKADDSGNPVMNYYRTLSLRKLGEEDAARELQSALRSQVDALIENDGKPSYFPTSLICTLPFEHDPQLNNAAQCALYEGLCQLLDGDHAAADAAFDRALELKPAMYEASAFKNGKL